MQEKCGIMGIIDRSQDVSQTLYYGLLALQHRGQESAGIVTSCAGNLHTWRRMGTVNRVFSPKVLERLSGSNGIGHTRYSTRGGSDNKNTQPFVSRFRGKRLALGHNGQITNDQKLKRRARKLGYIFKSTSDTEVINAVLRLSQRDTFEEALKETLGILEGAFSLVILYDDKVYAVRDRFGIRPLLVGETQTGYIASSESAAIEVLNGKVIRDVEPGEVVVLDSSGIRSFYWREGCALRICLFEYIYFSRPDSVIHGKRVHSARKDMAERFLGRIMATPALCDFIRENCDLVVPVPDSGNSFAIGLARATGLPLDFGLFRHHYSVGRTFIHPAPEMRKKLVRLKFNPIAEVVEGKRVALCDDSIVRLTTLPRVVAMLREAGAKEVHCFIGCPKIVGTCHLGINMPSLEEVAGSSMSREEIQHTVNADSLHYLELDDAIGAVGLPKENFCHGCMEGGTYAVPKELTPSKKKKK